MGVVNGYKDGTFGPEDNTTREQLSAMLANYARKVDSKEVAGSADDFAKMKDAKDVSDWAVTSIGWCFRSNIMNGTKDGHINTSATATRAETTKMVLRLHRQ